MNLFQHTLLKPTPDELRARLGKLEGTLATARLGRGFQPDGDVTKLLMEIDSLEARLRAAGY